MDSTLDEDRQWWLRFWRTIFLCLTLFCILMVVANMLWWHYSPGDGGNIAGITMCGVFASLFLCASLGFEWAADNFFTVGDGLKKDEKAEIVRYVPTIRFRTVVVIAILSGIAANTLPIYNSIVKVVNTHVKVKK